MKHVFTFDADRCCACSACMIGCMDQNDIDVESGDTCFRKTYDTEIDLADGTTVLRLSLDGLHALHGCSLHHRLSSGLHHERSGNRLHSV